MTVLKRTVKALLGRDRIGSNITVLSSDVFLVSYPRSGNTWLRFLIANALGHERVSFLTIEGIVPDIYQNFDSVLRKVRGRRILKSHEPFDPRYRQVIYLVRDPRDVLVSYYHFHRKTRVIHDDCMLDIYIDRFLAEGVDLQESIGNWGEHVGSWVGAREGDSNFYLISYEDLKEKPERSLGKLLEFLDFDVSGEQLQQAVRDSSFERMRWLEGKEEDQWSTTKGFRTDIPFVRSGQSGGWARELTDGQARRVLARWPKLCARLGYE